MQTLEQIEQRVRASLNTYNIEKSDDWIRQRARQLWEKQHDIQGLVTALLTSDPAERQRARDALIELRDIRAVDPLIATLQDKRWEVRCAAVKILGHMGDRRAIEALTDALSDPSLSVKVAAAEAIESLSEP